MSGSEWVQVDEPGYNWVSRHTWQSWRERYKKNSARLDVAIANIVSQRPVLPGEKGQYGYVRLIEEKGKKVKKLPKQEGPVPLDFHSVSSPMPPVRDSAPGNSMYPTPLATGPSFVQTQSALPEESREGGEWAIRISDASHPGWGKKRGLAQEDPLGDGAKRKRVDSGYAFRSFACSSKLRCLCSFYLGPLADALSRFSIEDDPCVRDIAAAYQFTPAEVGEYYLRANRNTGRTRRRFEKARELLDAMSDVE